MNRRTFIKGSVAAAAAVAIPFTAVETFVGIDLASGDDICAITIGHFDEYRRFQIEEICRMFRVPPHLLISPAAHRSAG